MYLKIIFMKNYFFLLLFIGFLGLPACKSTYYNGSYGQLNQTQVILQNSKFNVLGSFTGLATEKKNKTNVKGEVGLIAQAKLDLLEKAKSAGAALTGSRALINVAVDIVENENRVTVTVSGEIVEFVN